MSHRRPIVLVHGAWYGGWCWAKVAATLSERGHRVVAIDLPGRPGNPLPLSEVTAGRWVEHTRSVLDEIDEPVVLAAHSLGGVTITGVAEAAPSQVAALVFVAAFLLADGQAAVDVIRGDSGSAISEARVLAADGCSSTVDPRRVEDVFCTGCDPTDIALATAAFVPESTAVARTPVHSTADRFGLVPRHYVECTEDRVISIVAQREMAQEAQCREVFTLRTGHAPFLAMAGPLAAILGGIAPEAGTVSSP